jgi:hypothetical protein
MVEEEIVDELLNVIPKRIQAARDLERIISFG